MIEKEIMDYVDDIKTQASALTEWFKSQEIAPIRAAAVMAYMSATITAENCKSPKGMLSILEAQHETMVLLALSCWAKRVSDGRG